MALTERLALLISLDAQGAVKGLESVGKAADRNLGRTESKLDKTGQKFQKAGAGMLAGAGLAAAGLYKAGQSAADLEQAVGGTEAVFKEASGAIDKYAKGAARNMGLSEAAFRTATTSIGGQLKGVGFDIDESAEKSVELTQVAADLAATFGGTTAEAVAALGSAFRGEADPAERFNLRLNQNTVNAKAVALGLAESTSNVDAHAKAQATLALIMEQSADAQGQFARETGSASGAMAIASAEFENAKASLGQAVAPIIGDVASSLAGLASGFQSANEASDGLLSKLAAYGTIGLGAAGALSFVVGKAIEMRKVFTDLNGPFRNAEGGLSRVGKAAAGLGLVGAAVGLVQLARSMNEVTFNTEWWSRALADNTREGKENLQHHLLALEGMGDLTSLVEKAAEANVIQAESLIDVAESAGLSADRVAELREITDGKRTSDIEAGKAQQEYARQVDAAVNPTKVLAAETEGLSEKLRVQEEALEGVLSATLAQFDANLGYRQSVDEVEGGLADLLEVQKEHGTNSEEYRDKLLDVEGSLLDQAAAAVRLYEDQAKANGQTLTASEKTAIYRDELAKLRDSLAPGSPLRAHLDNYINRLNAIPANKTTDIVARFSTSGSMQDNRFQQYRGNADGTSYWGGGVTWVGERGPELVDLPRGSRIFDAQDSARMTGGGGTMVINITTGADPQQVVDAIKNWTRSNGALPASLVG